MGGLNPRTLRAVLFISLLVSPVSAFAQVRLPVVNAGITVPKVVDAQVGLPRIEVPKNILDINKTVSGIGSQALPRVDVKLDLAIVPKTTVSLDVGGSLARPEAGLSVGVAGTAPGTPPVPGIHATGSALTGTQVAERRLDQLPWCR